MRITKQQLRQIIKEELLTELSVWERIKSIFVTSRTIEAANQRIARVENALKNDRFKGYPSAGCGELRWCLEKLTPQNKLKCREFCGKNPGHMKKVLQQNINNLKSQKAAT